MPRQLMQLANKRNQTGFTIVELLIVIVVIGILAAITIVAYNGVQSRATSAKMQADMKQLHAAIMAYHADNGKYPETAGTCAPSTGGWCGWDQATNDSFIPGIAPKYIPKTPQLPTANANGDSYLYVATSYGVDYKLIRYNSGSALPSGEPGPGSHLWSGCNTDRWGYWSSDVTRCW